MEILWLGIGFLVPAEKNKSRSLENNDATLTRTFFLRGRPEESIKNSNEGVSSGGCIKDAFYKYSNWLSK